MTSIALEDCRHKLLRPRSASDVVLVVHDDWVCVNFCYVILREQLQTFLTMEMFSQKWPRIDLRFNWCIWDEDAGVQGIPMQIQLHDLVHIV